jgi:HD-GYP domain-containing protein (c-di-GMP phosphodiesterase class II)
MAKLRKILVDDLRPGMRFDKPLYIDNNNILVGANVSIKESDIKKLIKWGIVEIETVGDIISSETELKLAEKISPTISEDVNKIIEEYNQLLKKRKTLIEIHKRACDAVEKIYSSIRRNEEFTLDRLEKVLEDIIGILEENYNIFLFLYGLDEGKDFLVAHSVNVTFYALLIGIALKYPSTKLRELGLGTLLIDAGMVKVPTYITYKQSNLTDQEYNMIKTHPLHGYKALRQLGNVSEELSIVAVQHHEQYDGKGYPRGLRGNQINEYARIAAIADSYEALISNRSYRKRQFFYHAMRNLLSSGINKLDPVIMRVFLARMSVYPIGSIVELSDGRTALVIGSDPQKPLRPIVKLIFDEKRKRIEDTIIINLLEEASLYIVKALDEEEAGVNFLEVL